MLDKNHYFPDQKRSDSGVHLFIHRHWIAYFKWIAILSVMVLVPLVLIVVGINNQYISFDNPNVNLFYITIGSIYLYFVLALFITTWIDYYLDVTIVTRENLINIKQNELFSRSVAEQSLLRVQDVTAKQKGFFQSNFNCGTVIVETAGSQPNFTMPDIPDPLVVANTIMRMHEELLQEHESNEGLGIDTFNEKNKNKDNDIKINNKIFNCPKDEKVSDLDKLIIDKDEQNIISIQKPKTKKIQNNEDKQPEIVKISNNQPKNEDSISLLKNTLKPTQINSDKNDHPAHRPSEISNEIEGELKEGEEIKL